MDLDKPSPNRGHLHFLMKSYAEGCKECEEQSTYGIAKTQYRETYTITRDM